MIKALELELFILPTTLVLGVHTNSNTLIIILLLIDAKMHELGKCKRLKNNNELNYNK